MDIEKILETVEVNINNPAVLIELALLLPDEMEAVPIFHELARNKSEKVRAIIAEKVNLSEETVLHLLKDKSMEVIDNIVYSEPAKKIINAEILNGLLAKGFYSAVNSVISRLELYPNIRIDAGLEKFINTPDLYYGYLTSGRKKVAA